MISLKKKLIFQVRNVHFILEAALFDSRNDEFTAPNMSVAAFIIVSDF